MPMPMSDAAERRESRRGQFKSPAVLLSSTVLLVVWKHVGSPAFYLKRFASHFALWDDPLTTAAIYRSLSCLLLLGVVPAVIVKTVFGERLSQYGVGTGDRRRTATAIVALVPVFLVIGYLSARDPQIAATYPTNRNACTSSAAFALHALTTFWFYAGWEFHFRGYLQQGLRDRMGDTTTLLVQVLASTLIHVDGPPIETYGAIAGGLLWGALVFGTRSVLAGVLQHWLLGLSADYSICFLMGQRTPL